MHIIHRKKPLLLKLTIGLIIFTLLIAEGALLWNSHQASAADARAYQAGRIIDDGIFTNGNAMSVEQIQDFLNSKNPNCQSGYTCLKNYHQNPANGADNYGNAPIPAGAISAAAIIKTYSMQFSINPQVILATLQKEMGLVTHTGPGLWRFRSAMGYGCPDNRAPGAPACNPSFGSFSAQIYEGARHFRGYFDAPPGWWVTYTTGNNTIPFNPNSSCGSSVVNIQNRATVALYTYTPYQPNQSAINAGYGMGDGCGSYGNRNFFLFFSDWFGSPIKPPIGDCPVANVKCVWSFRSETNGEFFYTSDINERNFVHGSSFTYMGVHFFIRKDDVAGTIPVYRVYSNTGRHFWTTSASERDQLVATGAWVSEGTPFSVDPPSSNTGDLVHRLYIQSSGGVHVLTRDESYMALLIQNGYRDEGVSFTSVSTAAQDAPPTTSRQNVYRLQLNNEHFWTTNPRERDALIYAGGRYEGTSWQTPSAGQPLYRLYSSRGVHFWTTSVAERDMLLNAGWRNEGAPIQVATSGSPVYRLYNTRTGVHFWTISVPEKNGLLANPEWRSEDISWYY